MSLQDTFIHEPPWWMQGLPKVQGHPGFQPSGPNQGKEDQLPPKQQPLSVALFAPSHSIMLAAIRLCSQDVLGCQQPLPNSSFCAVGLPTVHREPSRFRSLGGAGDQTPAFGWVESNSRRGYVSKLGSIDGCSLIYCFQTILRVL